MELLTMLMLASAALSCSAENILVFLPLPLPSHYMPVEPIFHALARRGHNVTVVSPYPPKKPTPNLQHIYLSSVELTKTVATVNPVELAQEVWSGIPVSLIQKNDFADKSTPEILNSPVFQDLIHNDNHFDLILMELFFTQEAFVVLGHIFNAPVVTYSSYSYTTDILRYSGALSSVSYLPERLRNYREIGGPMSLFERLKNAWTIYSTMLFNEYWYYPQHDYILSKLIPGPLPRISDMLRNVSFYLLVTNTAIDGSKLYPPNVVEISGLHLREPKPLDTKLKTIMDTSKRGVVLFSLGTILRLGNFRQEDIETFLTVFKELDQTVLWKMDLNSSSLEIPKNVYVRDWFDQISILAHPNCVLFLTHGGLSSLMEAIRYAVPVVGMPFFGDQDINVADAVYHGYGVRLLHKNLTQKSLRWALKTTLEDPRFRENVKRGSKIFLDRPMSSLDTAVYWIEYVLRHKGAPHLKPLTTQMTWYQVLLLDVIAVFLVTVLLSLYFLKNLVIIVFKKYVLHKNPSKLKAN